MPRASTPTAAQEDASPPVPDRFDRVPIAAIVSSPHNPRKQVDPTFLAQLTASIRTYGVLEPLVLREVVNGTHEIIAGECRYRAAVTAGLDQVPAMIKTLTDAEALEIRLVENIQRRGLAPLEEAQAYRILIASNPAKYSAAAIAMRLGLSEKYVWDRMKLLDLVPDARTLLEHERMGVGHAILIARLKPEDQTRVIGLDGRTAGGLFTYEKGLDFEDDTEAPAQTPTTKAEKVLAAVADQKPVSVRELEHWIADHIRFDVAHMAQAAPLDFAPTATAVETAAARPGRGKRVVKISHEHHVQEDARDESERTFANMSWKRADGSDKDAKPCEKSVLGVVAVGRGYGQAFEVCVNRDCDVHWKAARLRREHQAKAYGVHGTNAKAAEARAAREAKAHEERTLRDQRWKTFRPALEHAIVAAAKKLKTVPARLFQAVLRAHHLPASTTVAQLPRALLLDAIHEDFRHAWTGDEPKLVAWARRLSVNAKALEPETKHASADAVRGRTPKPNKARGRR